MKKIGLVIQTLSVDANGEYHHYYDKVTPDMSIAVGIGWYAYKMNAGFGRSSEEKGVYKYNDGGDPGYITEFKGIMGDLEDALH